MHVKTKCPPLLLSLTGISRITSTIPAITPPDSPWTSWGLVSAAGRDVRSLCRLPTFEAPDRIFGEGCYDIPNIVQVAYLVLSKLFRIL